MRTDRVIKGLMLALPVIVLAACSSGKSSNSDHSEMDANTNANGTGNDSLTAEQARLKMEQLQHDNVVYFGYDKNEITPGFTQMLDEHAAFLRNNPSYKVTIEGHADERGTPEYNIALGERRANAVKMYLQGRGVNEQQIAIVSYGKEKPAVLGHDKAAYAKNRRAVLVY